jgi:hypothetical protein
MLCVLAFDVRWSRELVDRAARVAESRSGTRLWSQLQYATVSAFFCEIGVFP